MSPAPCFVSWSVAPTRTWHLSQRARRGLASALDELIAASDVPTTLDVRTRDDVGMEMSMVAYATVAAVLDSLEHPGPTPVRVEAECFGSAVAAGEGGGGLGRVGEPVQLGEPDRAIAGLDVAQHPAGADGGQLLIITDQPDAAAAPQQ